MLQDSSNLRPASSKADVNGQVSSFVYDANDQLTKETLPDGTNNTYEYEGFGIRTTSEVNGETAAFTYNEQQRLTTVATLADKSIASYTYDENGLRLTKTIGDTTHEYFYTNVVLDMEVVKVVKVNDTVTEYRSYKWSGYTPLSMVAKAKNNAGTFETIKEGEPSLQKMKGSQERNVLLQSFPNLRRVDSVVGSPNLRPASSNSLRIIVVAY